MILKMNKKIKNAGNKIGGLGKFAIPKMTRSEVDILLGTKNAEISERFHHATMKQGDELMGGKKSMVTRKVYRKVVNQRQEDVVTELLYPDGLTLGALLGENKNASINPYTREATMKALGRLMSKGIVTVNKHSRIVLDPQKITLTNHSPVAEEFEDSAMVGVIDA